MFPNRLFPARLFPDRMFPGEFSTTVAGRRTLFAFWMGGGCAVPSGPSTEGSLCICDLTFRPINEIDLSFIPMGLDVSLAPVNDLDIEFTPPCDC